MLRGMSDTPDLAADHALAAEVAKLAGELLMTLHRSALLRGRPLGDAGDALANDLILRLLKEHRPEDAVLTEEAAPDPVRLQRRRVWVIDPLDGTREFEQGDRPDWAVHVALAIDGEPRVGAVALPAEGAVLSTANPPALPPRGEGRLKIVVSRSRCPEMAGKIAAAMDADLVPLGSAGAKAMAVVTGRADAYLHAGGMHEWDTCAPVAVALAAGLHASRIDGRDCVYNRPNVAMPDLLICRPEIAEAMKAAIEVACRP